MRSVGALKKLLRKCYACALFADHSHMSTQRAFIALAQGNVPALQEALRQGVRLDAIESQKCLLTWALEYRDPQLASQMGVLLVRAGVPFGGSRHGGPKPMDLLFQRRLLDVLLELARRRNMDSIHLAPVWSGTLAGMAATHQWAQAIRALDGLGVDVRWGRVGMEGLSAMARANTTTADLWLREVHKVQAERLGEWLSTAEWLIRKGPPDGFPERDYAHHKLVDALHFSFALLPPEGFQALQRAWLETPAWLTHDALILAVRHRLRGLKTDRDTVSLFAQDVKSLQDFRDEAGLELSARTLASGGLLENVLGVCGQFASHEPFFQECLPLIGWAVDHGAGLKEFTYDKPSTWAWVSGLRGPQVRWEMLEALIEKGVCPLDEVAVDPWNDGHGNRQAMLPLAHALAPFSPQLLGPLFEQYPTLRSQLDERGGTFLHHACRREGNSKAKVLLKPLVELARQEPALLKAKDVNGETFLSMAFRQPNQEHLLDLAEVAMALVQEDTSLLLDRDGRGFTVKQGMLGLPGGPAGEPIREWLLSVELNDRWEASQPTARVRF